MLPQRSAESGQSGLGFRYALYRSYVLFVKSPIEPITEQILDRCSLGKTQRIEEMTYESPALPLSHSATAAKFIERDPERQPPSIEPITIEQHISVEARSTP
jgi:hypothetical protein